MRVRVLLLLIASLTTQCALAAEPLSLSKATTVANADRALVLVHGLGGDPKSSFGVWPELIAHDSTALADHGKLSDIAIYAVDYTAEFKSMSTLEEVATGVAADLAASSIFRRHRHVWFVAHSMGGLVLKRTFALWKLEGKTVLLDRVMGVGMLGVPAAGAPLADLVTALSLQKVATLFGWNGGLVKDLTTDSGTRYLDSLETDWMSIRTARTSDPARRTTPYVSCGYETKPQAGTVGGVLPQSLVTMVPKLFTSSICDDKRGFPVRHTDLTKPTYDGESTHLWLRAFFLRSALEGFKEQRVSLTTAPPSQVASFILGRVKHSNKALEARNLDTATQLPVQPELIVFADEKSEELAAKLVIGGGEFNAATEADLWEAIGRFNKCLVVVPTPNRLRISLKVTEQVSRCGSGNVLVCSGQRCD